MLTGKRAQEVLNSGYDCEEVFKYASPDRADHNDDVSRSPFERKDVSKLYAHYEGARDWDSWLALGKLKDGRYFFLEAHCDYTGWDCQAGGRAYVATKKETLYLVMTAEERKHLEEPNATSK